MADGYLNELLDRCVAIQLEALASLTPPVTKVDARPYMYPPQDSFPYFRNRIASNTIGDYNDSSAEIDSQVIIVAMRLIVAHLTEGYKGEPERKLYRYLPVLRTTFQSRMWLTSAAFPVRMDNLQDMKVIDGGSFRLFNDSGLDVLQVGAEIQLQCIFPESIDQDTF